MAGVEAMLCLSNTAPAYLRLIWLWPVLAVRPTYSPVLTPQLGIIHTWL